MRTRSRVALLAAALSLSVAMTAPNVTMSALTADAPAHDATVLVGLEAGVDATAVVDLAGVGEAVGAIEQLDVLVVEVAPGTVDAAIAAYAAVPGVSFAEPNHQLALLDAPDDPLLADQYQLDRIDALAGFDLYNDAVDAEPYATTGGARLAILDSGIDQLHPEFAGKISDCASYLTGTGTAVPGACQEANFHGTYVAGIASAIADNGEGIAGVGFDADLIIYQVCTYLCFTADSAAAMVDAADAGAEVANYSFGGPSPSETGRLAVEYANAAGVLQVAAAGNDGGSGPDSVGYPAAYPEVVAVAATDRDDRRASFSSFGPEVEVTAPGVGILSTMPGGTYASNFSGTSFSAPAVAGLGALLVGLGLDHEQARDAIVAGADPDAVVDYHPDEHGAGMANVAESVRIATGGGSDPGTDGGGDGGDGGGSGPGGPPEGRGSGNGGPPEGRGPGR